MRAHHDRTRAETPPLMTRNLAPGSRTAGPRPALLAPLLALFALSAVASAQQPVGRSDAIWLPGERAVDSHVAFRGRFELAASAQVEFRLSGASWYEAMIDGEYIAEGPPRFAAGHPEYQVVHRELAAGTHLVTARAHDEGKATRILGDMPPFLFCQAFAGGAELPILWRCRRLVGFTSEVRRINPQLGWIEWCDTRLNPPHWRTIEFDDRGWSIPVSSGPKSNALVRARLAPVRRFLHPLFAAASGTLVERFGYERDDIAARFFLRALDGSKLPAQGAWRRYDLGRVRLGRPRLVLDLPAGAVVEIAGSEMLVEGRVTPWIPLSAGPSCNLDHYVARGGAQEFFPLTPKGLRYLEIHVLAPPETVKFLEEEFVERGYHGPPAGTFSCSDGLLERIWSAGIETHRACCEDALIDNPTRERGQWIGDVSTVGLEIGSVGWSDLRLYRRALVQAGQCARDDGLVAGMAPGAPIYLATYALQWVESCLRYYELSGDRSLLEEEFEVALANLAAFEPFSTEAGLESGAGWVFIDWGYKPEEGAIDPAYNLHYLAALRAMGRWCELLERTEQCSELRVREKYIEAVLHATLDPYVAQGAPGWQSLGYHASVLALSLGLVNEAQEADCVRAIQTHLLSCFPNHPDAPRLSAPGADNRLLITPYFAHYAFPPLIERGQMDFVLDQYRRCWGWLLADGRTTLPEVFDTRWSHCHQWSGAPTWQLSRYVLGLFPRFDLGADHFVLNLIPGSLPQAAGTIPLPGGGVIEVSWSREGSEISYRLTVPRTVWIHLPATGEAEGEIRKVDQELLLRLGA